MASTRYGLSANLRFNIKSYIDRLLVNRGLYVNVASGQYDVGGSRADILRRVNGSLYESFTDNWVYESDASGVSPYNASIASGVYINGTFHQKGSGLYKPRIDYRNGRVFFDNPVPSTATVSAAFSYKNVLTGYADSRKVNWVFSQIKDSVDYTQNAFPSGFYQQLPVLVLDIQGRISSGFSLGGTNLHNTLIVMHVIANTQTEMEQIADILTEKSFNKRIKGVDFNKIPQLFTAKGDIAPTYKNYTQLQGDLAYQFPTIYITKAELLRVQEFRGVWLARIQWKVEVISNTS